MKTFLDLGTLGNTSALCLGAILNKQQNHQQKAHTKNMALNRTQKEQLFTV